MSEKQMTLNTSIRVNKRIRAMISTLAERRTLEGDESVRANEAILEMLQTLHPDIVQFIGLEVDEGEGR